MTTKIKEEILSVWKNSKFVFVSSITRDGFPTVKAMFTCKNGCIKTHYFSTNLSAKRTQQFLQNPNAAIYFCNQDEFKGLMLQGKMEVLTDHEHKAMLWEDGCEVYYPNGIDDEDYCVLRFTATSGNYYHGLINHDFFIDEIEYDTVL